MAAGALAHATAFGVASCVGDGAAATLAAIRAGISGLAEYEEHYPEPVQGGPLEPLVAAPAGPPPRGVEALTALFLAALQDLIRSAGLTRRELAAIPLLASLPSGDRSPRLRDLGAGLLSVVQRRSAAAIAPGSGIVTRGHAGAFVALHSGVTGLLRGASGACIVASLESYFDRETLLALDAAGRLRCARTPDGFAPGECAAAVLIETPAAAARRGARPLLGLGLPGFGVEERPVATGEPSTGAGLVAAVRAAAGADARPFAWAIGDLNGERYRGAEWAMARVRLAPLLGPIQHLWHPADCIGDVGAATGGMLLAMAAGAFEKGYAPADRALLFAGSDDGTRASLVVTAP